MGGSLLFCTTLLCFALLYIRHHPVMLSLLSLFLVRTILDANVERFVVLEDRIVIITRHLLPFMSKRRTVHLPASATGN